MNGIYKEFRQICADRVCSDVLISAYASSGNEWHWHSSRAYAYYNLICVDIEFEI